VVLSALESEGGIAGAILGRVLDVGWSLITFLAVPVITIEGTGPVETFKRSATLFRQRWGQQLTGNVAIGGAVFLLAVTLSFKDMAAAVAEGQAFGFPIATTIKDNLTFALGGLTLGDLYLIVILIAVYVCTLAIQGATVRLMFSMGRDRRLPFGGTWGHVNPRFRTPANAAVAVGLLAAVPFVVTGAGAAIYIAIAATGMIYLAYLLCNIGVLVARTKGWPHHGAWFTLGSWGTIINILALLWGGVMVVNIAIWTDPAIFGVFGNDLRNTWSNPFINTFIKIGGTLQDGLPAWPIFETTVGAVILVGALYYIVAQRGKLDAMQLEADAATGEAVIG